MTSPRVIRVWCVIIIDVVVVIVSNARDIIPYDDMIHVRFERPAVTSSSVYVYGLCRETVGRIRIGDPFFFFFFSGVSLLLLLYETVARCTCRDLHKRPIKRRIRGQFITARAVPAHLHAREIYARNLCVRTMLLLFVLRPATTTPAVSEV